MPKVDQQAITVLSAASNGLRFMTANDWALIADKAARVHFKQGETLIVEGDLSRGIYLLLKGNAKVQMTSRAHAPVLGPGEICGEMSLLEDKPASASVIAKDPVEAFHLDRATIDALFELFPHMASRFYRSLATSLASRLRDMIAPRSLPGKSTD